jgi:hypothetical protein
VTTLALVVVGSLILAAAFYINAVPLEAAFVVPPFLIGVPLLVYGIRRETRKPEGGATTQKDAVRLLRPSGTEPNRLTIAKRLDVPTCPTHRLPRRGNAKI